MEASMAYLERWTTRKRVSQDSDVGRPTNLSPGNLLNRNMIIGIAYGLATIATLIKTIAWYLFLRRMTPLPHYFIFRWFNQWPFITQFNFFLKWFLSILLAFFEYLPLTYSFVFATQHQVYLSLLTAYMEFGDNSFRMFQQLALQDTLYWFDWVAAGLLGLCVGFQGYFHSRKEAAMSASVESIDETRGVTTYGIPVMESKNGIRFIFAFLLFSFSAAMILLSLLEGATGQAYALATIATAAKTFAWWINQYPAMLDRPFMQKWLVGWGIGATLEYFPLIGAFTIASTNHVLLSVMTAYMEALDNAFRMGQQFALGKPLYWFDWCTALGMACAVAFQGAMHSLMK